MSNVTSRIRATIGALGILAVASPLAAQTHHPRGQMRYAAQWVDRSQGARQQWRAAGWRMGWAGRPRYAMGWGWRPYAVRRPMMRRAVVLRFAGPRYGWHRRPWIRARAGWRYYRD